MSFSKNIEEVLYKSKCSWKYKVLASLEIHCIANFLPAPPEVF